MACWSQKSLLRSAVTNTGTAIKDNSPYIEINVLEISNEEAPIKDVVDYWLLRTSAPTLL